MYINTHIYDYIFTQINQQIIKKFNILMCLLEVHTYLELSILIYFENLFYWYLL